MRTASIKKKTFVKKNKKTRSVKIGGNKEKCWSLQHIKAEYYGWKDKVVATPIYFEPTIAIKAMRDMINEKNDEDENQIQDIEHITEDFLNKMEPGKYELVYESVGSDIVVIICHKAI